MIDSASVVKLVIDIVVLMADCQLISSMIVS